MGFTNLLGLFALVGLPIIIILYMLRPKNKPMEVASLYLWKAMSDEIESATRLKKLKSSILMFLQMIIVILMAFILAGMYIPSKDTADKVLLVMEASYTMNATDTNGRRMDYAKDLAKNYIQDLRDEGQVSILLLEDVPKTLVSHESDHSYLTKLIDEIQPVDGLCSNHLVVETIAALKEPGQEVVYIGDRYFRGISNIRTVGDSKNYSVHNITYTKYLKEGNISALTQVYNHDREDALIQVSIYVDDVFFSAKQVEVASGDRGMVFFEGIPIDAKRLMVQIDNEDILSKDNYAYAVIQEEVKQKVLLVTDGNEFLKKALGLHPSVELYETDSAQDLFGYDLYVFDGLLPNEFPSDGAYLIFHPGKRQEFNDLGYVEHPVFTTNEHPLTHHIEKPEFATRISGVYDVEDPRNIIYNTPYGAGAFETSIQGNRALVFGFDIHDTDLPLSIEFPIMMMNALDYLLYSRMSPDGDLYTGDSALINIYPNTIEGSITSPSGLVTSLDLSRREYIFSGTTEAGIYTLEQKREFDSLIEEFPVNLPVIEEEIGDIDESDIVEPGLSAKRLDLYLAFVIMVLLLVEWLVFSYRRRIYEYKL